MPDVKFSNLYPYTDFHELNLDWIIKEVKFWSERVGKSIQKIELTGTVGLVDTYTISYSDGSTSTFDVTNGNGIASVAKTGTAGLVDTYTITFQDGTTTTFEVTNGTASVDDTLTKSDWAADAKITGDNIRNLNKYAAEALGEGFNQIPLYRYGDGTTVTLNAWVDYHNGAIVSGIGGEVVGPITVEGYEYVAINPQGTIKTQKNDVVFYDENDAFISGTNSRQYFFKVPANAVYMRFDTISSALSVESTDGYVSTFNAKHAETARGILAYNAPVAKTFDANVKIYDAAEDSHLTIGWLNTSTGAAINTASGGYVTSYINIEGYTQICKNPDGTIAYSANSCCFYDEDLTYLSYNNSANRIVTVPSGAKFVRFDTNDLAGTNDKLYAINTVIEPAESNKFNKYRCIYTGYNNLEMRLLVFGSNNLRDFHLIDKSYISAKRIGKIRDPGIFPIGEWYYIFYGSVLTTIAADTGSYIGVCRTKDFTAYEELDLIHIENNGTEYAHIWSPSMFTANGKYYLLLSVTTESTTGNNWPTTFNCGICEYDPVTNTAGNVTEIPLGSYSRVIDCHMYLWNGEYWIIGKNDATAKTIMFKSSSMLTGYTEVLHAKISGEAEEGQKVIRLDNGKYRLYEILYGLTPTVEAFYDFDSIGDNTPINSGEVKFYGYNDTVVIGDVFDRNQPYSFEEV